MKTNKYTYCWAIWTNWGYGWECESIYDKRESTYSEVKQDAREYRISGAIVKIKNKRILNKYENK